MNINKNNQKKNIGRKITASASMRDYKNFDAYNYTKAVYDDALYYLKEVFRQESPEYVDRDDAYDDLYNRCWTSDEVTGNASGSYTFNTFLAEILLAGNWDLIEDAYSEFGGSFGISEGAEAADVTVRCYMLGHVMNKVLDQLEEDGDLVYEEDEE